MLPPIVTLRDPRPIEPETILRASFLAPELARLKREIAALTEENRKLRAMLYMGPEIRSADV
jgi:hypothetical protein